MKKDNKGQTVYLVASPNLYYHSPDEEVKFVYASLDRDECVGYVNSRFMEYVLSPGIGAGDFVFGVRAPELKTRGVTPGIDGLDVVSALAWAEGVAECGEACDVEMEGNGDGR